MRRPLLMHRTRGLSGPMVRHKSGWFRRIKSVGNFIGLNSTQALRFIAGWTDGKDCNGDGTITVTANAPISFTDHTGITIRNVTTGETISPPSSSSVSPAQSIAYNDTFVTPISAGDIIEIEIGANSNYKIDYDAALKGWTGTANCTTNPDGTITVEYKDDVSWTDQTGIGFLNVTTGETATGAFTVAETSPSKIVTYSGIVWVTNPVAGEVIQLVITESNNYRDISFMDAQTLKLTNCLETNATPAIITVDSTDSSIVLADTMRATPTNGEVRGAVSFDSTGMLLGAGGWMFDLTGLAGQALLDTQGQCSITITAEHVGDYIGRVNTGIGSDSAKFSATSYLISNAAGSATSSTPYGRTFFNADNLIQSKLNNDDITLKMRLTSYVPKDTITVTWSWDGTVLTTYVDGGLFDTETFTTATDLFKYMHMATNRGSLSGEFEKPARMTDFVISTSPVSTIVNSLTLNIGLIGDSFIAQSTGLVGAEPGGYQNFASERCRAAINKAGYDVNFTNVGVGGTTITITGANDINDQVVGLLASNPTMVIMQGLTNDASNGSGGFYEPVQFEIDYKLILTDILNGMTGKVLIGTAAEILGGLGSPLKLANISSGNNIIRSLPAWANANGFEGRVIVFDLYNAIGTADIMFSGTWDPGYISYLNDLHLSSLGRAIEGDLWGATVVNQL